MIMYLLLWRNVRRSKSKSSTSGQWKRCRMARRHIKKKNCSPVPFFGKRGAGWWNSVVLVPLNNSRTTTKLLMRLYSSNFLFFLITVITSGSHTSSPLRCLKATIRYDVTLPPQPPAPHHLPFPKLKRSFKDITHQSKPSVWSAHFLKKEKAKERKDKLKKKKKLDFSFYGSTIQNVAHTFQAVPSKSPMHILKCWWSFSGSNLNSWVDILNWSRLFIHLCIILGRGVESGGSFYAQETKLLGPPLRKIYILFFSLVQICFKTLSK